MGIRVRASRTLPEDDSLSSRAPGSHRPRTKHVSCACEVQGLWEPIRWRRKHSRISRSTTRSSRRFAWTTSMRPGTANQNYSAGRLQGRMRQHGAGRESPGSFRMTAMGPNLSTHLQTFVSTLTTMLRMVSQAAAHPDLKVLLNCCRFWSGHSTVRDLDLLQPSNMGPVHLQDLPDIMPHEYSMTPHS